MDVGDSWSGLDGIACGHAVEQHALALLAHESVILGISSTCCDQWTNCKVTYISKALSFVKVALALNTDVVFLEQMFRRGRTQEYTLLIGGRSQMTGMLAVQQGVLSAVVLSCRTWRLEWGICAVSVRGRRCRSCGYHCLLSICSPAWQQWVHSPCLTVHQRLCEPCRDM